MVNKVAFATLIEILKDAKANDLTYDQNKINICSMGYISGNIDKFPDLVIREGLEFVDDDDVIEHFNITSNQFKRLFWFEGDTYPSPASRSINEQIKLLEKVMNES